MSTTAEDPKSAPWKVPRQESRPAAPDGPPLGPFAPRRLVRVGLTFYAVLAALAVVWRMGIYGESLLYASPADALRGLAPARDLGLGLGVGAVIVLVSGELTRRMRRAEVLARALASAVGPLTRSQCLVLALASGVAEEAFFRGALQPRVGLVLASVIFGLAHFAPRRDLAPWSLFSLAAGLLLGALFEATGNLVAPTVAHVTINSVNLPRLVRRYGPPPVRL